MSSQVVPQAMEMEKSTPSLRRPEGCAIVIFGATGDLTRRMIVPALYSLHQRGLLPDDFAIVGFSRSKWDTEVFRAEMSPPCGNLRAWRRGMRNRGEVRQTLVLHIGQLRQR